MITLLSPETSPALLRTPPTRAAIVSWNGADTDYTIDLRAHFTDGTLSAWLPYASSGGGIRRSYSANDERIRIDVDVLWATEDFNVVEVRFDIPLDALALATPEHARHPLTGASAAPIELAVPQRSQYLATRPDGHRWCSPTSLNMVLVYHGIREELLEEVAARVYDTGHDGTGNWTFNVAHAGTLGLRSAVVYLRDLDHARTFLHAGLPLVITYRWSGDDLPGAPLAQSLGHLAVLRGFDEHGDPILNDPAHPNVRVVYPRAALERVWLRSGGVAYAIASRDRSNELVELANA